MNPRYVALAGVALALLVIVAVSFFITRETTPDSGPRREQGTGPLYHVRSDATLQDVERDTGVPVAHLIRELALPDNVPTNVPLRQVSTHFGFEMREVRRIVREYLEQHGATPSG
jgi:hypothetical protein